MICRPWQHHGKQSCVTRWYQPWVKQTESFRQEGSCPQVPTVSLSGSVKFSSTGYHCCNTCGFLFIDCGLTCSMWERGRPPSLTCSGIRSRTMWYPPTSPVFTMTLSPSTTSPHTTVRWRKSAMSRSASLVSNVAIPLLTDVDSDWVLSAVDWGVLICNFTLVPQCLFVYAIHLVLRIYPYVR